MVFPRPLPDFITALPCLAVFMCASSEPSGYACNIHLATAAATTVMEDNCLWRKIKQRFMSSLARGFRAAIYCRLSKDNDLDGTSASIENQRDMLEKFCEKQGWGGAAVYQDDGDTGRKKGFVVEM